MFLYSRLQTESTEKKMKEPESEPVAAETQSNSSSKTRMQALLVSLFL